MQAKSQGVITLVLDLTRTIERVSSPVVRAWATHFNLPKIFCVSCGYFEHQKRVQFNGYVARVPSDPHGHLPWVKKWNCLLLRVVVQDALGEVTKVYPHPKVEGFRG